MTHTTSRRTLWVLLAGAVLTGWCSASIVSPPAVGTQTLPASSPRSAAAVDIPSLALAIAVPRTPPTSLRNPFAFGTTSDRRMETPSQAANGPDGGRQTTAAIPESAAIEPEAVAADWRLIGIATSPDGHTAVLAGRGGVQLVRLGDRLPDGRTVLDLTDAAVTLGLDAAPPLVLRLP